ncbi:Fic family protein [Lysobacter sp. GX 14042]|uniref:Fic family protein n=1 Tax=Lysobacter sp. GX 14042 TaxID=2907155 RepID=UPI001F375989|nr:Fic family protein [Lysobacter sp. GX 14042]MCE7033499.1 Fic family protein [Lysobacter sp. GX 14042]
MWWHGVPDERRYFLRQVEGHTRAFALVAPPVPDYVPPTPEVQRALIDAHEALGALRGVAAHFPGLAAIDTVLAQREAVASSQIKGARSTLRDLLTYEATGGAQGLPADVEGAKRCAEVLTHGLGAAAQTRQDGEWLRLINRLHAVLMGGDQGMSAGAYRRHQVWIGQGGGIEQATFVPAPPEWVAPCMAELERRTLKNGPGQHAALPLVAQLAFAHGQFQTIRPFHDGNGRVGRMLLSLLPVAHGYPPLYLSSDLRAAKAEYYSALACLQVRGDWAPWLVLLCEAIVRACEDTISVATDLNALVSKWEAELSGRQYRSDSATARLPRLLVGRPIVSVRQVAENLSISKQAANVALGNLVDAGILSRGAPQGQRQVFQASDAVQRLERPSDSARLFRSEAPRDSASEATPQP